MTELEQYVHSYFGTTEADISKVAFERIFHGRPGGSYIQDSGKKNSFH
jgi:hypothetical protein